MTGFYRFSAVLPYFWFPTSIFVKVLKLSLRNMPKGKKAVSYMYILDLDLYSSLLPFRNKSLISRALGFATYARQMSKSAMEGRATGRITLKAGRTAMP